MEDESLSSVDQFLRDNGFSISDSALGLASLSGDELLDDDLLLSDAEEHQSPHACSSSNNTPRFVLLEDEGLLTEQQEDKRLSGDRTSERREDEANVRYVLQDQQTQEQEQEQEQEQDSLERSMLFGGSEISVSNGTPRVGRREQTTLSPSSSLASSSSASSLLQPVAGQDSTPLSSVHQRAPQQREDVKHMAMVSAASSASLLPPSLNSSSSVSSGRVLDDELNDALGVPRSSIGEDRLSLSSRRSIDEDSLTRRRVSDQEPLSQQSRTSHTSRTQRSLFANEKDGDHTATKRRAGSMHDSSDDDIRWDQPQREESLLINEEVEEKKEDTDDESTRRGAAKSEQFCESKDAAEIGEGAWNGLNDLLRKNGLPAVRFRHVGSEILPDRDSLFSVVHDFVVQTEQKNATIQDLVLVSQRNSRARERQEGELRSVEKKSAEAQKTLEKAKAEIQRLKALQKKDNESAELLSRKLKNSCLRLQQQLKVSEHRVKAKEVVVEKMQAKLQQQLDKETSNKMRDRGAFRNLQDRDPRRANPRDTQMLETIGVYEAQREQMQEEIDRLRLQVAALNSELRDKDNFIARQANASLKSEPPVWEQDSDDGYTGRVSRSQSRLQGHQYASLSIASDEAMLEQLEAARREQEVAAAKLRHREAVMMEKVATIEQELLAARETIGELKEENANLSLEAESRPSIRDYRLSQRRIYQLERQVAENKLALEEASDLNELRKYMGTKELVERDRLNHRLHLNRLNTLPRETTLEVVKHVCRILHLTDITLIAPSLDKLCSVVAAVPRMEKFIRDVCGFVFLHLNDNIETTDMSSAKFELEKVLPTLQQWMMERRKLHALEGFKTSIVTELCKRVEPGSLNDMEDTSGTASPPSHPTTLSRAVHIVSELVELEKSVMHHREIYTQAAAEIEQRPNVLINQIVRHFSHLFEIKSIEGVLPKINEIYLQVNEMKNFLHVIRDVLHLRKDTSLVQCLNVIKERLQESGADATRVHAAKPDGDDTEQERIYASNSPNFVVEKHKSQASARGEESESDLVGVRQVRQMSILVRELKRELGASTMDDILPRTKRLMELLSLSIPNDPEDDEGYE